MLANEMAEVRDKITLNSNKYSKNQTILKLVNFSSKYKLLKKEI